MYFIYSVLTLIFSSLALAETTPVIKPDSNDSTSGYVIEHGKTYIFASIIIKGTDASFVTALGGKIIKQEKNFVIAKMTLNLADTIKNHPNVNKFAIRKRNIRPNEISTDGLDDINHVIENDTVYVFATIFIEGTDASFITDTGAKIIDHDEDYVRVKMTRGQAGALWSHPKVKFFILDTKYPQTEQN